MKKYLFLFVFCLFSFCFGIVFAEENLIAQSTAVKEGNLTFQLPYGFAKHSPYARSYINSETFEGLDITAYYNDPNMSIEQILDSYKQAYKQRYKIEEVNFEGRKLLFVDTKKDDSNLGVFVIFCEKDFSYRILYSLTNKNYTDSKYFLMNIIRTAK